MENQLTPIKTYSVQDEELANRFVRFLLYKFRNIIITSEHSDKDRHISELKVYAPLGYVS